MNDARLCTYLVGLKPADVEPPLADFQGTLADKEGTMRLVRDLNMSLSEDRQLPEMHLSSLFELLWPQLQSQLESIAAETPAVAKAAKEHRTDRELLEEVLQLLRDRRSTDFTPGTTAIEVQTILHTDERFSAFVPGARVRHPSFGVGSIVTREAMGKHTRVVVNFDMAGKKTLIMEYAKLDPIL
jgi:hypothetical protein